MLSVFSPSFLICLAIIIILVGGMFMFFNQKITQQNDKINGMFDLVNTMAEEMNYIRSTGGSITLQPFASQTQQVLANLNGGFRQSENELIQVSDEDDDEDEDDEDDDDDDEDEDDEDEDDDQEDDNDEENNTKNIKIINILSESIYGVDHNDVEIIEEDDYINNDSDDDSDESDNDDILDDEDDKPVELIDLINHDALEDHTNYKTFLIDDKITINDKEETNNIDLSMLKSINISSSSSNENIEYKKMSLNKLREIVIERKLTSDSSKMKKNELLKLLE
uniref:Rho termination factor N-terminal domain-containing protein n=1 Tax=viral metagenome TaxID=1070528 RepID=A0A6C0BXQ6_9ZZZZ